MEEAVQPKGDVLLSRRAVTQLTPQTAKFLYDLAEHAEATGKLYFVEKKKNLAEKYNKTLRTITRYMDELKAHNIIQTEARRGRNGGTVIQFNSDYINFPVNEHATLYAPEDYPKLQELIEKAYPKKQKQPNKRHRRTKKEIEEEQKNRKQAVEKSKYLNSLLAENNGVPTWEMFQTTNDPILNYRAYMLSRLHNQYAKLFAQEHNEFEDCRSDYEREPEYIPVPDKFHDELPTNFFGTAKFEHFKKLISHADKHGMDASAHLSVLFEKSRYMYVSKGMKGTHIPFPNTFLTEASLERYRAQVRYFKHKNPHSGKDIVPMFINDPLVGSLVEEVRNGGIKRNFLQYKQPIHSLVRNPYSKNEKIFSMFYTWIRQDIRDHQELTKKQKQILKQFILQQGMVVNAQVAHLNSMELLSSEQMYLYLWDKEGELLRQYPREEVDFIMGGTIGNLLYAHTTLPEANGEVIYQMMKHNKEEKLNSILQLIQQRHGRDIPFDELREALEVFGKHRIPLTDANLLNLGQVEEELSKNGVQFEDLTKYEKVVERRNARKEIENREMQKLDAQALQEEKERQQAEDERQHQLYIQGNEKERELQRLLKEHGLA